MNLQNHEPQLFQKCLTMSTAFNFMWEHDQPAFLLGLNDEVKASPFSELYIN